MTASSHASPPLLQSYLRSHAGRHHDRVSSPHLLPDLPPAHTFGFARPTWGRGLGKSFGQRGVLPALKCTDQDSTWRAARRPCCTDCALLDFTCSAQASAEHFQQCAEFSAAPRLRPWSVRRGGTAHFACQVGLRRRAIGSGPFSSPCREQNAILTTVAQCGHGASVC